MSDQSTARPRVHLCECAARDGLQHEEAFVPTAQKIALIDRFTTLGLRRIEATSFSHPTYVPQFSDAEQVLVGISRRPGVVYKTTCVNLPAVRRAIAAAAAGAGPDEVSFPISASEAHNQVNTRRSIAESQQALREIASILPSEIALTATVASAYSCPFTGPIPLDAVHRLVDFFVEIGVPRVIVGDSSGYAYPNHVRTVFTALRARYPDTTFIAHFHDNRGAAIANVVAALDCGVDHFDCSFGGLGGHPAKIKYAEGRTGNVATEDVVCLLEAMGYDTGVDLDDLVPTAREVERVLGRELHGRVARAGGPWESIPASAGQRT